ncbi:serine/threonine-protein kinase WNK2 [Drosophila persimilis]|uniref:serine/threonine-protein kinase WNK2 n=1 Tax=Drosophila persimilis TaxID=7234 RepID=UPI000F087456|nr:serine/threonine-protein kinase WNK2 [Drosophila persimilis]
MKLCPSSRSIRLLLAIALTIAIAGTEAGRLRLRHSSRQEKVVQPTEESSASESAGASEDSGLASGKHKRGILHGHHGHALHASAPWPARTYAAHYGYSLQLPGASSFLAAGPAQVPIGHRHGFVKLGAVSPLHGLHLKPLSLAGAASGPGLAAAFLPAAAAAPAGSLTPSVGGGGLPLGVGLASAVASPSYVLRPGNAVVSSYSVNYPHQHLQKPQVVLSSGPRPVHFHGPATAVGVGAAVPAHGHGHVHAVQPTYVQALAPAAPAVPVQPVQSFQPIQPVQHYQPLQPLQPVQPIQPVQHFHAVQPVQQPSVTFAEQPNIPFIPQFAVGPPSPGFSGVPTFAFQPAQPAVPAQPPQPAQPAQPASAPEGPEVPQIPQIPDIPQIPAIPQIPQIPQFPVNPQFPGIPQFQGFPQFPGFPQVPQFPQTPTAPAAPAFPQAPPNSQFFPTVVQPPLPQQPPTFIQTEAQFPGGIVPLPGSSPVRPETGTAIASPQIPPQAPEQPEPEQAPPPPLPTPQQPWKPVFYQPPTESAAASPNRPSITLLPPYGSAPAEGYLPPAGSQPSAFSSSSGGVGSQGGIFDQLSDAELEHIFAQANLAQQQHHARTHSYHHY